MNKSTELYWKKRYNDVATNSENDADIGIWSRHGFERRFESFFHVLEKNHTNNVGKKILDVGCGSGAYTRKLTDMEYTVVGIDYSEQVIKRAVEKSRGMNIPYIIGALPFLPLKRNYFDIIICIGVLQNIPNEKKAINEFTRILKDNGRVILMTLNSLSLYAIGGRILQKLNNFLKRNGNCTLYDKKYNYFKLKNILIDNGFNNLKYRGVYIFPKMLIFLEKILKENLFFMLLDKIPIVSLLFSHAFLIDANKEMKQK